METKAALIGADGGIELHPVSPVDLYLSPVIHPGHPEGNDPLRLGQPFQKSCFPVGLLVLGDDRPEGLQDFLYRLQELRFMGVLFFNCCIDLINV